MYQEDSQSANNYRKYTWSCTYSWICVSSTECWKKIQKQRIHNHAATNGVLGLGFPNDLVAASLVQATAFSSASAFVTRAIANASCFFSPWHSCSCGNIRPSSRGNARCLLALPPIYSIHFYNTLCVISGRFLTPLLSPRPSVPFPVQCPAEFCWQQLHFCTRSAPKSFNKRCKSFVAEETSETLPNRYVMCMQCIYTVYSNKSITYVLYIVRIMYNIYIYTILYTICIY